MKRTTPPNLDEELEPANWTGWEIAKALSPCKTKLIRVYGCAWCNSAGHFEPSSSCCGAPLEIYDGADVDEPREQCQACGKHILTESDACYNCPVCLNKGCLLYTSPSPRDRQKSRMPSSA